MKNGNLLQHIGYAWSGLKASWKSEKSLRIQIAALAFVIIMLLVTKPAPVWWAVILLTSGGVIGVELINTALEKLIDYLHPDHHPTLKIVKDTLAAAVLVMCVAALFVFVAFIFSEFVS